MAGDYVKPKKNRRGKRVKIDLYYCSRPNCPGNRDDPVKKPAGGAFPICWSCKHKMIRKPNPRD